MYIIVPNAIEVAQQNSDIYNADIKAVPPLVERKRKHGSSDMNNDFTSSKVCNI